MANIHQLLKNVCPTQVECSDTWSNQLETAVAENYKGADYKRRIKTLLFNLKKNGANLYQFTPQELATMTTTDLALGTIVADERKGAQVTIGGKLDSISGGIEILHESGGNWFRNI